MHKKSMVYKIGILAHASFGGSARIATELAAGLANLGHCVHWFSLGQPAWGMRENLTYHVVERALSNHPATLHTEWQADESRRFLTHLIQVTCRERLDILHFHYAIPFALLAAQVKCQLGSRAPRVVGTLHGTDVSHFGYDVQLRTQLAQALPKMDALTAVSLDYACLAAERFHLINYPDVIPNFVNLARFHPLQQASAPSARPAIVHISNFRPVKNPLSVARIFAAIRKELDVELWLVGEGQEMDKVKQYFRQNGLEDSVRYWGLCRQVAPILAQAKLLLMTSRAESFCLAALEAMACGVPVLSSRVGGVQEVVVNGKTGYLFAVDDEQAAAGQAIDLLTDTDKYQAMSKAAVVQARRFNQRTIVTAYEHLYESLLTSCSRSTFHGSNALANPSQKYGFQPGSVVVGI